MEKFKELVNDVFDISDESIIEHNKYMVIANKGLYEEEIYGVYDNEIDAYRRLQEVKMNRTQSFLSSGVR